MLCLLKDSNIHSLFISLPRVIYLFLSASHWKHLMKGLATLDKLKSLFHDNHLITCHAFNMCLY